MDRSDLIFRACLGAVVALWFAGFYGAAHLVMQGAVGLPSVLTAWDAALPFWPSFAPVYLSITPLLCLPLLILPDRSGLLVLALTMMVEIVLATTLFVVFPVADPPVPAGPYPALFRLADLINLDFNNLPSLHVALTMTTCLALRPALGRLFGVVAAWAALISFSTLVTRQHDLVSLGGGLVLAAVGHRAIAPLIRRGLAARG